MKIGSLIIATALWGLSVFSALAQQPQTQTAPTSAINAKYVNGVAPGYAPTAGSGLTLNLGGGTANCAGTIEQYAASTLTMTASTTNYVYLNTGASCIPAVKTTTFVATDIPIATVVTSGSAITAITDDRTAQTIGAGGTLTAVTGTAPMVATPSGSTVNMSMQDSTVTPGTYLNVAFTVSAKGLITAAGPPFSASFGCTQCGTYEIGYSGITAASGAISYANPSVPTSASVSDGTNTDTLSTPFTSWVLSHTYTTNTTFTLTTLGNGQTVTQSNGIAFVPRSYGGTGSGGATGATASGTSAALVGASGTLTNIGLGSSCAGQSFTATTSGTQYVYYLSPCNVSNPGGGSFTIPGPTVFPMNAPTSFTFTGQYGGTWGGYLYQSVNAYVSGTSYTIGVGN